MTDIASSYLPCRLNHDISLELEGKCATLVLAILLLLVLVKIKSLSLILIHEVLYHGRFKLLS